MRPERSIVRRKRAPAQFQTNEFCSFCGREFVITDDMPDEEWYQRAREYDEYLRKKGDWEEQHYIYTEYCHQMKATVHETCHVRIHGGKFPIICH